YREDDWRYLVYNRMTQTVDRIDAIDKSCVQLPEDHGIIFPGGYYLHSSEKKSFTDGVADLRFKRTIRSPNGEDVLYVFYAPESGVVGLFAYNMIRKELANPIICHGYALADNGNLVIFSAEKEPTRVHAMQLWRTPYVSDEYASQAPTSSSFYGRIGNAELVRGVSDLLSVCRLIDRQAVSAQLYEELNRSARKLFDDHYWLSSDELNGLGGLVGEIAETAELVIDEFEKVRAIREQSEKAMREAEQEQKALLQSVRPQGWSSAQDYVDALARLRKQRGHLMTIREYRYIDTERLEELGAVLEQSERDLGEKTVVFLGDAKSLEPYRETIEKLNGELESVSKLTELMPIVEKLEDVATGLDLLSELMGTLQVDDATVRTQIIDAISQIYAMVNRSLATARLRKKNLGSEEAVAQFSAQFKLFSQSITNALGLSVTPEKCDENMARLLVQLEELESQFSDYDQFLSDILEKREEVYESFESHKQQLMDERQRKSQSIADAADRILASIEKRALKFAESDELNTYFASDPLVLKIGDLGDQLRDLDSTVKADDIDARFKGVQEKALRALRDKSEIYEEGGQVIKLGPRHRFSVNTQEFDLTILPREGRLDFHLTGTDYYETLDSAELLDLREYWDMSLASESSDVYRAEYLAFLMLESVLEGALSRDDLDRALLDSAKLEKLVRDFASPRYKEGYTKGVHDHDAALILQELVPAIDRSDLLRFDPSARALAQVYWANISAHESKSDTQDHHFFHTWHERALSAAQLKSSLSSAQAHDLLVEEVVVAMTEFLERHPIPTTALALRRAADYLVHELSRENIEFITSKYATELVEGLQRSIDDDTWRRFQRSLGKLLGWPAQRWELSTAWVQAMVEDKALEHLSRYVPEAVAMINVEQRLVRRSTEASAELNVEGLLGEHARISDQGLALSVDSFLQRLDHHCRVVIPAYYRYLEVRKAAALQEREALRLDEFKPKPLSSFVRNRLINESYLPLIGDNLAKQMGTVGESKRSDLMGLLMMISPPGYGKTTLMEYVAERLGLIFMKINCPSLGHDVTSLDPSQAPDATAGRELEKLNLALEMGSNVMLYLDDIQHTNPEFLQKFISLCDGTRRIEGVWKGVTKTYDMRGRKFCVVMAGNPYTESGEAFKVPDMLANRADIYNLGDILSGMDEQFALSYVENALTSNAVLSPLATREMDDVYKLIAMSKGASIASTDLAHEYSGAEINEITEVLRKMFVIQDVVLKINQQYIASAAQDDRYRTEPAFKLQGSYRNMNKMTEKVSAIMNVSELQQMIDDHYLGEAQLLTTGAEANLLKLGELRGTLSATEHRRWDEIKSDFLRNKAMGGDDADTGAKLVAQLVDLVGSVDALGERLPSKETLPEENASVDGVLDRIATALENAKPSVKVVNEPVPGINAVLNALADSLEHSIMPLVRSMDKKLEIDLRTHEKMV
ncbi:MAG: DNA repair ATPase, partial [Pseudomonadota bacterium]